MIKRLFLVLFLLPLTCEAAKKPVITTTSCPQGQTTVLYAGCNIQGKWGVKPYTYSLVAPLNVLPTGLALNTVNSVGQITGTPTVVGTTQFKVRLTDSTGGTPKTYDQTLYINIIATPVPPANPVVITTSTPLPAGLVNSVYNTTVSASGGNGTYAFTVPVGTLPAGLNINSSSGAITGTPTAPGTSSFTVKATDTSTVPSSAQQNYYIAVANPVPAPTYLFKDDFESNTMAAWTDTSGVPVPYSTGTAIVHAGTYSAGTHYVRCGDSTNPACGQSHQDNNNQFEKTFDTASLPDVWTRGYFYIKHPEPGGSTSIARKLFYDTAGCFSCSLFPNGDPYSVIVGVLDCPTCGLPGAGPLRMSFTQQQNAALVGGSGQSFVSDCGTSNPGPLTGVACALQYDTWYSLEMQVHYNTQPVAPFDGHINIWINGTQVYNWDWSLNRGTAYHIRLWRYGAQTDRDNYLPVDEFRYWDDVIINNSYIGP